MDGDFSLHKPPAKLEREHGHMPLLRSLTHRAAGVAINMALLTELFASQPPPLRRVRDACKVQAPVAVTGCALKNLILGCLLMAAALAGRAAERARPAAINFSREIAQILSDNCFQCHGPDEKARKAKLRFDTKEGAFRVKDGVGVIVPGKSSESELYRRISTEDPDDHMPPAKSNRKLSPQQIQLLKRWIDEGANWGEHWAFEKLSRPEPPGLKKFGGRVLNPIDNFIFARLEKEALVPSEPAAKETLIRRVTLDLTGLPPTPNEVDGFLKDNSPQAYDRVVERLLKSPAFGERMAWDWLDVARYADSNGYQGDAERTMWPWRDWVVTAFNRNLPYDQFTIWQLAGDFLPNATLEQKLATGFCRNHAINGEGGRIAEENRVEYAMDMTETMGTTWLGLTVTCCRCHDHKFDPLTQHDYYSLLAFFNQTPVDGSGEDPQGKPNVELPTDEQKAKRAKLEKEIAKSAGQLDSFEASFFARSQGSKKERGNEQKHASSPGPCPPSDGGEGKIEQLDAARARSDEKIQKASPSSSSFVGATNTPDKITGQVVGQASRLSAGRLALGATNAGETPGAAGGTPTPLPAQLPAPLPASLPEPPERLPDEIKAILKTPAASRSKEQLSKLEAEWGKSSPDYAEKAKVLRQAMESRDKLNKAVARVMVMEDMPKPRETYILEKGIYDKRGEVVTAAVPAKLQSISTRRPTNRLGLAEWLTAPENPLTARVTVNRFWQQFFGVGLVKTAEDFGMQGEKPVNAALLDWLASEFVRSGWDMKALCGLIVTSATYRQSSKLSPELAQADPENRLLARGPRFRMPSWMIRDQALAASGLLVNKVGGSPVKPYQPSGVWEEATFGKKRYEQSKGGSLYRRSLYTFWRRIIGPTMFFDTAARQVCTVKQPRTNVPLHALTTLNDITYVEAARALAQRVLTTARGNDAERIEMAFRLVLSRKPNAEESAVLLASVRRFQREFAADPGEAKKFLAVGESKRDQTLDTIEHAAYAGLCATILNLDEAVTKE